MADVEKELGKLRKNCLCIVSSSETTRVAKRSRVSWARKSEAKYDLEEIIDLEKRPPAPCGLHHVGGGRLGLIVLWLRHVEEKRAEKRRKKKDKEERTRRKAAVGTWRLLVTSHLSHTPVPVWLPAMSFSNINVSCVRAPFHADKLQDPAAVSALLDQLRASQAWRDVLAANPPQPRSEAEAEPSVANLLEQLQPPASSGPVLDRSPPPPARQEHRDLQSYTFQQALPVVANLASDPTFLLEIQKVSRVALYV